MELPTRTRRFRIERLPDGLLLTRRPFGRRLLPWVLVLAPAIAAFYWWAWRSRDPAPVVGLSFIFVGVLGMVAALLAATNAAARNLVWTPTRIKLGVTAGGGYRDAPSQPVVELDGRARDPASLRAVEVRELRFPTGGGGQVVKFGVYLVTRHEVAALETWPTALGAEHVAAMLREAIGLPAPPAAPPQPLAQMTSGAFMLKGIGVVLLGALVIIALTMFVTIGERSALGKRAAAGALVVVAMSALIFLATLAFSRKPLREWAAEQFGIAP
jgi:hypothetical protein